MKGIESFRQKYNIPVKRGMRVEWYLWSRPSPFGVRFLLREFNGNISSVKEDTIHCKGHCWWVKAKFRFKPSDANVVLYGEDGSILLDTRESSPSDVTMGGARVDLEVGRCFYLHRTIPLLKPLCILVQMVIFRSIHTRFYRRPRLGSVH